MNDAGGAMALVPVLVVEDEAEAEAMLAWQLLILRRIQWKASP